MQFIGIDGHTDSITVCRADGSTDGNGKKRIEKFSLDDSGIKRFIDTLTPDTHVLMEATITAFQLARAIQPFVKEVIVANTYELKQISFARKNTDKVDAEILCKTLKMQVISGETLVSSVFIPPIEIQELRSCFTTYRLYKKETTQIKNRIHSILKENLYGFTKEEIFSKKRRQEIRELEKDTVMSFEINELLDTLEYLEGKIEKLKDKILEQGSPFMKEIDILTSMKGISVFIALAIIADIVTVRRFRNSKAFTSYLRSAPVVRSSNTSVSICGTNKKGRKLAATLITQSLNHIRASSLKLEKWFNNLTEYKKAGLVRSALRRRVFAEIYQMLKKGEYHYGRYAPLHEAKMDIYKKFLKERKNIVKSA